MSSLPLPGDVPFHLSVLSSGIAAIEAKHAEVADLLHEVAGPPVLFRNPRPTQSGDASAVLMPFEEGAIYWSEGSGAHEQHGLIFEAYLGLGAESSPLGLPLSDVGITDDGEAEVSRYQRGAIFSLPDTGTSEVHGAIHDKWTSLGAEHGLLGLPVTHEQPTADGAGRFNEFQNGSIYWHPDFGAVTVSGPIRERWKSLGAEKSYLGYPVADEVESETANGRRVSQFQNGAILSRPDGGVLEVPESVVFNSGPIVTDETLGGSIQLVVNSRGEFAYIGHMHNSGFFKLNFVAAMVLHGEGQAFVIPAHSGSVDGHNPLSDDDHGVDWRDNGSDALLRDRWQVVKSSSFKIRVDIGADAGEVIGLILLTIFIVGAVFFVASPGAMNSRQCPDGTTVFWKEGSPPPDCLNAF